MENNISKIVHSAIEPGKNILKDNYNTLRSEMSCVQKGTPSVWCPFRGLDRKRWHGEVFSKSHPSGVIGSQMMTPLKFHALRRIHNKSLL